MSIKTVVVLLFCICFVVIKSEENKTIQMSIDKHGVCTVDSSYDLLEGTQYTVEVCTHKLSLRSFRVNEKRRFIQLSNQVIFYDNATVHPFDIKIQHRVYYYKLNVKRSLRGIWQFKFNITTGPKKTVLCITNITTHAKDQKMNLPSAPKPPTPSNDSSLLLIALTLFGIIVLCQTLYIIYMKRQKFACSCRDISKRPPYPLPPEVYDYVDASGQGVTNNTFNIADERTPIPARKIPQEPTHRSRRERLGFQAPKTVHERTTPKIGRKLPPPPKVPSHKYFGQAHKMANKKITRNVTKKQVHDSRLIWEENWEYEQLSPMQKYL
ncbi:hypothetical protein HW555_007516 [Spodoptera exigua]|uniref:Uncharacterized protein n=1 Tax=Spodoptera exigua TaxID=7107 RepID=A0A835L4D0_SPOEX|nr:hypothetical protein HW555_007516 [Spodoptera exigua]